MQKLELEFQNYLEKMVRLLQARFGQRLLYVGLQGIYLRGEATENSDIDIMVIIDGLDVPDLDIYRQLIAQLPSFDKSCGFICSKDDLAAWNPLEICHLIHSTKDYYGKLCELVPAYTAQDVRNFVKMSLNNLYHELCHRYIHSSPERNAAVLPGTYKGVFFILQNLHYLNTGNFLPTKTELLAQLKGKHRAVLERSMVYSQGKAFDFRESYELLLTWCQETLQSL